MKGGKKPKETAWRMRSGGGKEGGREAGKGRGRGSCIRKPVTVRCIPSSKSH
jgi:hypothetical protein